MASPLTDGGCDLHSFGFRHLQDFPVPGVAFELLVLER